MNISKERGVIEAKVEIFSDSACLLGESPVWSDALNGLFWLDILQKRLYFRGLEQVSDDTWDLPYMCSSLFLVPNAADVLLLLSERGLAFYGLRSKKFVIVATSGDESFSMRSNDAGIDRNGRIWYGTMQKEPHELRGGIYSVNHNGGICKKHDNVGIPNTFIWSRNGDRMIHADSLLGIIQRSRFDVYAGTLSNTEIIVDLSSEGVEPDGSAMDEEDCFWNAQWGGGRVVRYDLDGFEQARFFLPVQQPTSCAFGGEDMMTLFVTSARVGLSSKQIADAPLSGSVFRVRVQQRGRALTPCAVMADQYTEIMR